MAKKQKKVTNKVVKREAARKWLERADTNQHGIYKWATDDEGRRLLMHLDSYRIHATWESADDADYPDGSSLLGRMKGWNQRASHPIRVLSADLLRALRIVRCSRKSAKYFVWLNLDDQQNTLWIQAGRDRTWGAAPGYEVEVSSGILFTAPSLPANKLMFIRADFLEDAIVGFGGEYITLRFPDNDGPLNAKGDRPLNPLVIGTWGDRLAIMAGGSGEDEHRRGVPKIATPTLSYTLPAGASAFAKKLPSRKPKSRKVAPERQPNVEEVVYSAEYKTQANNRKILVGGTIQRIQADVKVFPVGEQWPTQNERPYEARRFTAGWWYNVYRNGELYTEGQEIPTTSTVPHLSLEEARNLANRLNAESGYITERLVYFKLYNIYIANLRAHLIEKQGTGLYLASCDARDALRLPKQVIRQPELLERARDIDDGDKRNNEISEEQRARIEAILKELQ